MKQVFQPVVMGIGLQLQNIVSFALQLHRQFTHRTACDKFSFYKNTHTVTYLLHLVQLVGRNQYGSLIFFRQLPDKGEKLPHALRIDSERGLIHNNNLGILHQNIRNSQPLLHTAGVGAGLAIGSICHAHSFQHFVNSFFQFFTLQAIEAARKPQVLPAGHIRVKAHIIRKVPGYFFHLKGIPGAIITADLRSSPGWLCQPQKHQRGSCLSCPVRSEQAEDLALADFQKKLVHRGNSAVTLGKSFCFNYCF